MPCAVPRTSSFPSQGGPPPSKAPALLLQGALSSPIQLPIRAKNFQDMKPQIEYGVEMSRKFVLKYISAQNVLNFIVFCQINLNQRLKIVSGSCHLITSETSFLVF